MTDIVDARTIVVLADCHIHPGGGIAWPLNRTVLITLVAISLLLIWRHRENIRRLAAGTESRLGSTKK